MKNKYKLNLMEVAEYSLNATNKIEHELEKEGKYLSNRVQVFYSILSQNCGT
jgi:hypothetical protein